MTISVYQISHEVGRGYPATATLTPTLQEATPVITSFSPMSGVVGDTITVFGLGLANVMAIKVAGIPMINIAVSSDNEINFVISPETTSELIEVTTPGGTAISSNSLVIDNNTTGSGFTGFVEVSESRSLADDDLGKILICDTSSSDITIILDETALTNPINFSCQVFNKGTNKVIFATASTFLSQLVELSIQNSSLNIYYQSSGIWFGL